MHEIGPEVCTSCVRFCWSSVTAGPNLPMTLVWGKLNTRGVHTVYHCYSHQQWWEVNCFSTLYCLSSGHRARTWSWSYTICMMTMHLRFGILSHFWSPVKTVFNLVLPGCTRFWEFVCFTISLHLIDSVAKPNLQHFGCFISHHVLIAIKKGGSYLPTWT